METQQGAIINSKKIYCLRFIYPELKAIFLSFPRSSVGMHNRIIFSFTVHLLIQLALDATAVELICILVFFAP